MATLLAVVTFNVLPLVLGISSEGFILFFVFGVSLLVVVNEELGDCIRGE